MELIEIIALLLGALLLITLITNRGFVTACATLMLAGGTIFYGVIHYDGSFSYISGTVTEIHYDDRAARERNRHPSLNIFLRFHSEPFVYRTQEDKVRAMRRQLKVGDEVDIAINGFQDIIWAMTVNGREIIALAETREAKHNIALFQIRFGLLLCVILIFWERIAVRLERIKTKLKRRRVNS